MVIETFGKIRVKALEVAGFTTTLFIIAIYFSTSLAMILSVVLGLIWLFSAQFMDLSSVLKKTPVALWSLLLYGCFIVGLSYGNASSGDAFSMLSKYRELFFIPVLLSFLTTERFRYRAWYAFIVASVAILLISYLMHFGIIDLNRQGDPCYKSRITHSIFIAFFAFFCMHKVYDKQGYAKLYLILLIVCMHNLFFIVEGRTGQLTIIVLALLFAMQRFTVKKCMLTIVIVVVLLVLYLNFSEKAGRITEGVANTQAYLQPVPEQTESSMGQRYTFWKYSLKLIAEKPLLGHGTGSFAIEYQRIASGESFITNNPHNEFLMVGVQLGGLGLLIYVSFIVSQYYYAKALPKPDKFLAQGVLVTLIVSSLFNTPFLDHTEGHWFAVMIALCFSTLQNDSSSHA